MRVKVKKFGRVWENYEIMWKSKIKENAFYCCDYLSIHPSSTAYLGSVQYKLIITSKEFNSAMWNYADDALLYFHHRSNIVYQLKQFSISIVTLHSMPNIIISIFSEVPNKPAVGWLYPPPSFLSLSLFEIAQRDGTCWCDLSSSLASMKDFKFLFA